MVMSKILDFFDTKVEGWPDERKLVRTLEWS